MIKRNFIKIYLILMTIMMSGCSEYEVVEIQEEVIQGPVNLNIPDDKILFPPEKNINTPDGPVDLGDPLIPDIEVSFIQHDFGTRELTDPGVSKNLIIKNVGDYPLRISDIKQSSISNSFSIIPLNNSEIMPGMTEALSITYTATKYGPDADNIKIQSNDPDEQNIIILVAGRGATPELIITPISKDFGNIDITATPPVCSINLSNAGDGLLEINSIDEMDSNLDINISTYPALKLPPGQQTGMDVIYSPSNSGSDEEKIKITSNDPIDPKQKIIVKGSTADPDIDSQSLIDFGILDVGSSLIKTVKIDNLGTGILQINGIYFSNSSSSFSILNNFSGDISPGSYGEIDIEYHPNDFISDYSDIEILSSDPDEPTFIISLMGEPGIPQIDVDPLSVDFGSVNVNGISPVEKVKISNIGTGKLTVVSVSIKSGLNFSLSQLAQTTLFPGDFSYLEITYSPTAYAPNADEVYINSDDPASPSSLILVKGWGSAPQLEIYPDPYDFGTEYIECDIEGTIDLKNVGNANLEITNIEYFTSFPNHFSIDYDLVTNGPFPWTISAGSQNSVYIEYLPLDITVDSSFIRVHSNDPQFPTLLADQYGEGIYYSSVMDTYTQNTVMMSDILFIIDNSCSMGSWQTHVATNFDSFITVFKNSGVDYHIGIITTDSSALTGGIIDTSTIDPIYEFNIQAQVGTYGSGMERGLDMAYEALQPGGSAAPGSTFERADAKMSLIFVSDEPDYSYELLTSLDYSAYFKSVKVNSSKIIAHDVSGGCPSGCSMPYTSSSGYSYTKWASCNYDYEDVVSDMGGTHLDLCDADWGLKMETLAKDSIVKSSFDLSDTPVEKTIEVLVDGVITGNWSYDPMSNSVIFDPMYIPIAGSLIDISYNIFGC